MPFDPDTFADSFDSPYFGENPLLDVPAAPSDTATEQYVDNAVAAEASSRTAADTALDARVTELEDTPPGTFDLPAAIHEADPKSDFDTDDEFAVWDNTTEDLAKATWNLIRTKIREFILSQNNTHTGTQTFSNSVEFNGVAFNVGDGVAFSLPTDSAASLASAISAVVKGAVNVLFGGSMEFRECPVSMTDGSTLTIDVGDLVANDGAGFIFTETAAAALRAAITVPSSHDSILTGLTLAEEIQGATLLETQNLQVLDTLEHTGSGLIISHPELWREKVGVSDFDITADSGSTVTLTTANRSSVGQIHASNVSGSGVLRLDNIDNLSVGQSWVVYATGGGTFQVSTSTGTGGQVVTVTAKHAGSKTDGAKVLIVKLVAKAGSGSGATATVWVEGGAA